MPPASFPPVPQKEEYIVVCTTVEKEIKIHVIGCKSKTAIADYTVAPDNIRGFLDAISTMFDPIRCKAILFDIYKFEPIDHQCPHVINFCYQVRGILDELKIKHFFYADRSIFFSGLLISAKVGSSKGDTVLFLLVKDVEILVFEYIFTELGYQKIRNDTATVSPENESFAEIREKILAGSKPKNVIVFGADMDLTIMKKLKKNIFTQEKLIFRDKKTLASESIQHSLKIAKYVQDRGYTKYHVIPTCAKKYRIHSCDAFTHPFLEIEVGEQLPYKFEDYVPRSCNAFCITGFDDNGENEKLIYETVQEENDRHRSKITVVVDPESFPLLLVKPVIIDLIQDLPARLDKSLTKKIPVIVFCDNFSVICACKKDETNYSYLADWNGMFGHDASILIDGEKREFGWEAKELKYNLHESGVFDMVSLMSKELEDITFQHRPALGKDPETKLCSLMTNLIEEHFGVIREATGSPVEEVAFWLLLTNDESKNSRFKERLVESFKPLGIVCHLLKLKVPQ